MRDPEAYQTNTPPVACLPVGRDGLDREQVAQMALSTGPLEREIDHVYITVWWIRFASPDKRRRGL